MVSIELTNWINNELPEGGAWWSSNSAEFFHKAAGTLLAKGLSVDEIKELFTNLYSAVAEEYN